MSKKLKVLSGVPQGMVLRPLIFLLYVMIYVLELDHLSDYLLTTVFCMYRVIKTTEDNNYLQQDLNILVEWTKP